MRALLLLVGIGHHIAACAPRDAGQVPPATDRSTVGKAAPSPQTNAEVSVPPEDTDAKSSVPTVQDLPSPGAPPSIPDTTSPDTSPPTTTIPAAPPQNVGRPAGPRYDLPLSLPGSLIAPTVTNARDLAAIAQIKDKQQKFPTYEAWRQMAAIYLKNAVFADAARCYRAEAAMYRQTAAKTSNPARKDGLINAALVQEAEAARYETSLQIYRERAATESERKTLYTGATLEPIIGCYLGAFIDRDDQLKETYNDENWQSHRTPEEFAKRSGVTHATNFMYVAYGQKFPRTWVLHCKQANVIPHIAWEPKDLNAVRDDTYLQGWAQAIRAVEWPVFIRFAGEMNGFWTPYHKNPKLYREKFALLHRTLKRTAPLVATIWCVNSIPVEIVQQYYPGDDNCDWVGINLYSVPFYDNDPRRPAFLDNPTTLLEPIYNLYAKKKPIAICEYAASHQAAADRVIRDDFAIDKMAQLYTSLPARFPRVKLIDWFSMNNLVHAKPGRQLNNYNLTARPKILANYQQIAASPYFLSGPEHLSDQRPPVPFPLTDNAKIKAADLPNGTTRFVVWLKTYVSRPKVYARLNNKIVYASNRPGAHTIEMDLKALAPGTQTLIIYAFDDKNRFVTSMQRKFSVAP